MGKYGREQCNALWAAPVANAEPRLTGHQRVGEHQQPPAAPNPLVERDILLTRKRAWLRQQQAVDMPERLGRKEIERHRVPRLCDQGARPMRLCPASQHILDPGHLAPIERDAAHQADRG